MYWEDGKAGKAGAMNELIGFGDLFVLPEGFPVVVWVGFGIVSALCV